MRAMYFQDFVVQARSIFNAKRLIAKYNIMANVSTWAFYIFPTSFFLIFIIFLLQ